MFCNSPSDVYELGELKKGLGMPKILLVDDSDDWREDMEWAARGADREIDTAKSAGEAIRKIDETRFDLVVTDLHIPDEEGGMPDIEGGMKVLDAAKAKDPYTQVIVCTAAGTNAISIRAMRQGAFDYLERVAVATAHLPMLKKKIELALEFRNAKLRATRKV